MVKPTINMVELAINMARPAIFKISFNFIQQEPCTLQKQIQKGFYLIIVKNYFNLI